MQDLTGKITGSSLTAAEWNQLPEEVQRVITNAGITLSGAATDQLVKALALTVGSGSFYTDGGSANAYSLSNVLTFQNATTYSDGLKIRFRPAFANTGASTVNVAGVGIKDLVDKWGDPLSGNELNPLVTCEAEFDLSNNVFKVLNANIPSISLSASQVIPDTSAAWVNVTEAVFPVVSGATYILDVLAGLSYEIGATDGVNFGFLVPSGSFIGTSIVANGSTALTLTEASGTLSTAEGFTNSQFNNAERMFEGRWLLKPTVAGTAQFRVYSFGNPGNEMTIHEKSLFTMTRIA